MKRETRVQRIQECLRVEWAWVLVAALCALCSSCNREDLSSGPSLSKLQKPPPPPPPPPPSDCPTPPSAPSLKVKINEFMVQNDSAFPDENGVFVPWIELYNNTDAEMDLRNVPLSDEPGKPDKWRIPCVDQAKVPPRGFLVIFCDGDTKNDKDFHASFVLTPKFLQLIVNKGSDLLFYDASKLDTDFSAGRYPDGGAAVSVLSEPTGGEPNKEPLKPKPPSDASFLRGDANGDGHVNITDMTTILKVLFQSAPAPRCQDAMDANDDGTVNLTDVTYIGQALYQHGPTFPPPYPAVGQDPTVDSLPCPAQ